MKSTLVDDTADALRQMILQGKLCPGDFLPSQKELAAQFGVGASTIHEAIQVLVAVGWLQSHPGKGTWVRRDALDGLFQPEAVRARLGELNIRSLCEARSVIEVALTELAATRATAGELQQIRTALSAMREKIADTPAFVKADLDFHLSVARAGHNDLLAQFYQLARRLLEELIHDLVSLPEVKEESIRIQAAILATLEAHDSKKARLAAEEHMHYIYRLLES